MRALTLLTLLILWSCSGATPRTDVRYDVVITEGFQNENTLVVSGEDRSAEISDKPRDQYRVQAMEAALLKGQQNLRDQCKPRGAAAGSSEQKNTEFEDAVKSARRIKVECKEINGPKRYFSCRVLLEMYMKGLKASCGR